VPRCLTIVESAYGLSTNTADASEGGNSVLDFLRSHDRARPGPEETFQFVPADVPPCPVWSATSGNDSNGGGTSERPYLDGTHLLYPDRNALSRETVERLFHGEDSGQLEKKTYAGRSSRRRRRQPYVADLAVDP